MKPVDILKKGLQKLRDQTHDRKVRLEAELKANRPISEVDEEWLDHTGNLVDEERVVEELDKASDYEAVFEKLNQQEKSIEEPQTKANATLAQQIEILNWYHTNGKHQSWTANHFNKIYPFLRLKQPKISDWLKHEASWRAEYKGTSAGVAHSVKRVRQTQHPEVMEMLDLWVSEAMADKLLLTGEVIHQKWKAFADCAGVPTDKHISLSEGWLSRYKVRNGLKQTKRHSEAASASPQTVDKECLCMQGLIKNGGYKL
ncbi:hypothetical protein PAXRUDRAFT_151941 [Paxillus rubicundulus Ve08.2h10]|uniref:HTH CENPB-type domain-containing protein n=1 Tax=Paxillus rubicundulus Ve08.2h10 TaxID=930991 RepID=A0A0D0DHV2_9AGAM|nr:hypothetical protein PAXRUDRAFT_151941 [Paxillus rubicundulus Ve08.2h10]